MIALASDCLVFEMTGGERVPVSAEMISIQYAGTETSDWDEEFLSQAASGVFDYFKHELRRQTVSLAEFSEALEKVLQGFKLDPPQTSAWGSDLNRLAREFGPDCELFFFSRLREELRRQLLQGPATLRFHSLRNCVKQLAGARRWNPRCRRLHERIIEFLRGCLSAESSGAERALVVE